MSQCPHTSITVNARVQRHTDELVSMAEGMILLWIGQVTCDACGQQFHMSQNAILDNETGAVGFELLPSDFLQRRLADQALIAASAELDTAAVDADDFEFVN